MNTPCTPWKGLIDKDGYGRMGSGQMAHRFAYIQTIGPIPPGFQLDHLCHSADPNCSGGPSCPHRSCVNPLHLEPVTPAENMRRGVRSRKNECDNGHAFDEANTYLRPRGGRDCRECHKDRARRYRQRKAA